MKIVLNKVVLSFSIYFFLTLPAIATPNTKQLIKPLWKPILIVQNNRNFCRHNESVFVSAETKGFWINICGGDEPNTYIGVSKKDGSRIRLKLSNYEPQGNYYEAINGDVSYALIKGTTKGDFLSVTRGNKQILKQPILNWE
jgi:hypothetical protein